MVLLSKKAYRHPFSVKNADGTPFFITFVHNINKKTTIYTTSLSCIIHDNARDGTKINRSPTRVKFIMVHRTIKLLVFQDRHVTNKFRRITFGILGTGIVIIHVNQPDIHLSPQCFRDNLPGRPLGNKHEGQLL